MWKCCGNTFEPRKTLFLWQWNISILLYNWIFFGNLLVCLWTSPSSSTFLSFLFLSFSSFLVVVAFIIFPFVFTNYYHLEICFVINLPLKELHKTLLEEVDALDGKQKRALERTRKRPVSLKMFEPKFEDK